jgi:flagellar hook-basal body complex protein FliE
MSASNIYLIDGLQTTARTAQPASDARPVDYATFRDFLINNLERVNQMQSEADTAVDDLVTGRETDITKVMSAVEKADVAFQTLMAVRGNRVDSYTEIMQLRL